MNRHELDDLRMRFFDAEDNWDSIYGVVKRTVGHALANESAESEDEAGYPVLRQWWLSRWHGFKEDTESLYVKDDDIPRQGINAIERCFFYPNLAEAVTRLREYGRDEKIISATFQPAENFWVCMRGRLDDLDRATPSLRQERMRGGLGWIGGRTDWVEAHPRTLMAFGLLIVGVLAWQVPSILREITELIRAMRGG